MFGIGVLPAIIQGVGMLYMPKSPRFLLLQQDDFQVQFSTNLFCDIFNSVNRHISVL